MLERLSSDPIDELTWLNKLSLKHLKNYQIWHHRQVTMTRVSALPQEELAFLSKMMTKDAKNYHVWSYRQWLVQHFDLWPTATDPGTELPFIEALLKNDVRNNSAWNHRFYVLFGGERENNVSEEAFEKEIEFAKSKIDEAPQNASAWNYLKGVLKKRGGQADVNGLEDFAKTYADLEDVEGVKSSHAMDFLAGIWADKGERENAEKALTLLAERFDPIRKNYWEWRKGLLGVQVKT